MTAISWRRTSIAWCNSTLKYRLGSALSRAYQCTFSSRIRSSWSCASKIDTKLSRSQLAAAQRVPTSSLLRVNLHRRSSSSWTTRSRKYTVSTRQSQTFHSAFSSYLSTCTALCSSRRSVHSADANLTSLAKVSAYLCLSSAICGSVRNSWRTWNTTCVRPSVTLTLIESKDNRILFSAPTYIIT